VDYRVVDDLTPNKTRGQAFHCAGCKEELDREKPFLGIRQFTGGRLKNQDNLYFHNRECLRDWLAK